MKKKLSNKVVRFTLHITLLLGITLLTSCVFWGPAPRPPRNVVIIEKGHSDNGNHKYFKHNNGRGNGNGKHKNRH